MAWTADAKKVFNDALLAKLQTGSGTARISVYNSSNTQLHAFAINTATSSVNGTTGVLTLLPGTASTSLSAGTANYAKLFAEDDTELENSIPVVQGSSAVTGYVVLSSLDFTAGGAAAIVSATIG